MRLQNEITIQQKGANQILLLLCFLRKGPMMICPAKVPSYPAKWTDRNCMRSQETGKRPYYTTIKKTLKHSVFWSQLWYLYLLSWAFGCVVFGELCSYCIVGTCFRVRGFVVLMWYSCALVMVPVCCSICSQIVCTSGQQISQPKLRQVSKSPRAVSYTHLTLPTNAEV